MINATGATPPTFSTQQTPQVSPVVPTPPPAQSPPVGNNAPKQNNSKPTRKSSSKLIFGGLFVLLLIVGAVSVSYLVNQNQDVRNQASVEVPGDGSNPYAPTPTPVIPDGFCKITSGCPKTAVVK